MPVLPQDTLTRFGYLPESLSPGSGKLIVYTCDNPGCTFVGTRAKRTALSDTLMCRPCAIRQSPPQGTIEKRRETLLKNGTNKTRYQKAKETLIKKYGVENISNLDWVNKKKSATRADKRGPDPLADLLGTYILSAETKTIHGASYEDLTPGSDLLVACVCQNWHCHRRFNRARRNLEKPLLCHRCLSQSHAESYKKGARKRNETYRKKYPTGRPASHTSKRISEDHKKIATMLESWGLSVGTEHLLPSGKFLDIYVPRSVSGPVAVEYGALYFHNEDSPQPRDVRYHWSKTAEAENNGIRLFTIFDDEWLGRTQQVTSLLRSALIPPAGRVPARKCTVRPITSDTAKYFINRHHIQACSRVKHVWGLYHGDSLLGVISAGIAPDAGHDTSALVIDRLCFVDGIQVVGGASKLVAVVKKFAREKGYKKLVTWSDNRISQGNVYRAIGFAHSGDVGPRYEWVNTSSPRERVSRASQRRKHKECGCSLSIVECGRQHMKMSRIFDCGKKRWELPV